eukprot:symbB.v1.2.028900.t1/scaffold3108.1/size63417/2
MSQVFGNVGLDATVYGLSPNFPCCTVNFGQGWGKFVALGLWLFDGGDDHEMPLLLSAAFSPSTLELPYPLQGEVQLDTDYPFNPKATLRYRIRGAQQPFQLLVRVPLWADLTKSEVHGSSGTFPIPSGDRPSVFVLPVNGGADVEWQVRFAMDWKLTAHAGSGAFSFGPLSLVKRLEHRLMPLPLDDGPYGPGAFAPDAVRDEMLLPVEDWAYGFVLNSSWKEGISQSTKFLDTVGFDRCWLRSAVSAVRLLSWAQSPMSLQNLVPKATPRTPEDLTWPTETMELELVPMGCTKLRMSRLPLLWRDAEASETFGMRRGKQKKHAAGFMRRMVLSLVFMVFT